jgi:ABC-type sulfate transport system substrate-binding protein
MAFLASLGIVVWGQAKDFSLLNGSYDPTREFYQEYNTAFSHYWKAKSGDDVTSKNSHGGSVLIPSG